MTRDKRQCTDNYLQLLNNDVNTLDNVEISKILKDCFYLSPGPEFSTRPEKNPYNKDENCKLISSRKVKYYTHTYDPSSIIKNIRDFGEISEKNKLTATSYMKLVEETFDLKIRHNCCNCISITLYLLLDYNASYNMRKYLLSIKKSVENVKENLPGWIVRVYLDSPSIYETILTIKDEGRPVEKEMNILEFLFTSDIVEIYTFVCKSSIGSDEISISRANRFLPMMDETVNICASREADGIVTNLDCHNLKVFSRSNRIFYLVPLTQPLVKSTTANIGSLADYSYQQWITVFKTIYEPEFFDKETNIYTMLAGAFSIKLKVKKEVYEKYSNRINVLRGNIERDYYDENITKALQKKLKNAQITIKKYVKDIEKLMSYFDEIFLLDIFKELISVPYQANDNDFREITKFTDENKYELIKSLVFYDNGIELFLDFLM